MNKDEIAIRLDELRQLKKIDCFNSAYSTDPRPSKLLDIRIQQLASVHFGTGTKLAYLVDLPTIAKLTKGKGNHLYDTV